MPSRFAVVTVLVLSLAIGVSVWWKSMEQNSDDDLMMFRPPDLQQRLAAIGDVSNLPEAMKRVFDPADEFQPMKAPQGRDWLANYPEGGQTFATFLREDLQKPNHERFVIYLQPLGSFDAEHTPNLEALREFTETYFTLETKLLPPLKVSDKQLSERTNSYTNRPQWSAGDLMKIMESQMPSDAFCMLGITMTDLYGVTHNFVFGQATMRGRVGVFSFARFDPDFFGDSRPVDVETLILRRSCRVLAHEVGHMFGMPHCIHFRCVMNGSNHLAESDSRPLHLCPVCLRKVHTSVGFNPIERDQALLERYQQSSLTLEAEWTARRLSRLTAETH